MPDEYDDDQLLPGSRCFCIRVEGDGDDGDPDARDLWLCEWCGFETLSDADAWLHSTGNGGSLDHWPGRSDHSARTGEAT